MEGMKSKMEIYEMGVCVRADPVISGLDWDRISLSQNPQTFEKATEDKNIDTTAHG